MLVLLRGDLKGSWLYSHPRDADPAPDEHAALAARRGDGRRLLLQFEFNADPALRIQPETPANGVKKRDRRWKK